MKNHFTWVNELPSLQEAAVRKFGSVEAVAHQIALLNRRLKYAREAVGPRWFPTSFFLSSTEVYVREFERLNNLRSA